MCVLMTATVCASVRECVCVCVFLLFLSAFTICMRFAWGNRAQEGEDQSLPEHEPGFDNFLPLPRPLPDHLHLLITLFLRFTFYFYIDFIFIESFCSSLKFVFG